MIPPDSIIYDFLLNGNILLYLSFGFFIRFAPTLGIIDTILFLPLDWNEK